ncbi:DNA primase [Xaviernesmea oryzae]|uniref:DNA primase n=1 Tax=Xaviernesmea oryzae TaxID=464029 RepID=A0A1Q9B3M9_9HYPH|nr:toprim domain-containing protein [Xaviernesmea oryzae]OLP62658.1 DNA primase [Xaviernesmea oryzae]SEM27492.1 Toprim domain-containing protein [Xaviernesmea oryzae]
MGTAGDLASCLAREAEAVCRHYLSAGTRAGQYWVVGDTGNNKGRSLYVRLTGDRAGRWTDAATGQFGDLLDLIRESCGLIDFQDVADEARRYLSLPPAERETSSKTGPTNLPSPAPPSERARRLFAMGQPIDGTLADRYLRQRGILDGARYPALRFHPACYYRDLATGQMTPLPALLAAVTDAVGQLTGLHRTWLDRDGLGKAKVATPRRAIGGLLANAVRLQFPVDGPVPVMTAGEGLESVLSLAHVMPHMPMAAALSVNHLAALSLPPGTRRLYIAADADAAGRHGVDRLSRRAQALGILPLVLAPELGDYNEDLRQLGPERLTARLRDQLVSADAVALLPL